MNTFLTLAKQRQPQWEALLHHLHCHPELSFQEHETTRVIKEKALSLGLEIVPLRGMETGLVCVLRGAYKGPMVGIRADIDAIAETDLKTGACRSENAGVMHACGHDLHTCCALGAAELLASQQQNLHGDVVFLFQPAEEVTQGAAAMVSNGLWQALPQKLCALFSLHCASFAAGLVGVRAGAVAASKTHFRICITGRGGQGGFPHECVDAIVAGSALVQAIQTIVSRNADPRKALVCAVYNVHAGDHEFFVTDTMQLSGSVRALDSETAEMAMHRVTELCESLPKSYGCTASLSWIPHVPVLENDAALAALAQQAAECVVGAKHVLCPPPMLGSDDFSIFGKDVPIFYYQLGAMNENGPLHPLHSPHFETNRDALSVGSALLAQSAMMRLQQG